MLKLNINRTPPRSIWLVAKVAVGKNPQNDVVLNTPGIDDFHAEFQIEGDRIYLLNKSHQAGTYLNGEKIVDRHAVKSGDVIKIHDVSMDVIDPKLTLPMEKTALAANADQWLLRANTSWLAGQEFPVHGKMVLGRDPACDLVVPGTHLSRQHAEITVQDNVLHIKDLGSTNGTFVNGQRIVEAQVLPGDEVRFDVLGFIVVGPNHDEHKTAVRTIIAKEEPIVVIDENPAVRIGEAKATCLGNRDDMVEEYNQLLAKMAKENQEIEAVPLVYVVSSFMALGLLTVALYFWLS